MSTPLQQQQMQQQQQLQQQQQMVRPQGGVGGGAGMQPMMMGQMAGQQRGQSPMTIMQQGKFLLIFIWTSVFWESAFDKSQLNWAGAIKYLAIVVW